MILKKNMINDQKWMQIAIAEAKKANKEDEIPVGAIIVRNDELIAQSHNQPIVTNDPSAHAEIQALRIAGKKLKNYRIKDSTLYVTLEPCAMCFGAIMHARIERIVYGAHDPKTGVCGSCIDLTNSKVFNHQIHVEGGILENACSKLLQDFFKIRRNKLNN